MRTRKHYPDNPGVMYADYFNVLRLGYRGCATQGYKTIIGESLTLSQTTNFGLFQTEEVCRRQFQV